MSSNEQLEKALWELIYELLSPDEEATLRQRITSDPELARAYAKIKLQTELVAAAAKCDDRRGTLVRPGGDEVEDWNETSETDIVVGDNLDLVSPKSRSNALPAANWIVAAAAMGLVVMSAISLTQLRSPAPRELAIAEATSADSAELSFVRTVVTTPAVLSEDTMNYIAVSTTSQDGTPTSTSLELKLFGADDHVKVWESFRTDESGKAQVELSGALVDKVERLEVTAENDVFPPLITSLSSVRSGHLTHLTTDLPIYQPGDTVRYRSLSLSRFDQRVDGEVSVEFDVLDDRGTPVPNAKRVITSEHGVGGGDFTIPANAAYGKLTIQASSPDGMFPTQQRDVLVREVVIPNWNKELKLARDSYEPGDRVEARLSVTSQDGQPAVDKQLKIYAYVDQQPIVLPEPKPRTDAEGKHDIYFFLPQSINRGDAVVTVDVADDQFSEQVARVIPIHTGRADVHFFPEGGDLVSGLHNHVYFQAWDLQGRPIHLEGRVVDDDGNEVARAVTVHEGRGKFAFTTQAGAVYQLIVEKPAGAKQELMLPRVSSDAALVLHTSGQVLDPHAPLDITLRMRSPDRSLVLAAACRGGLVGLDTIERFEFTNAGDGTSECQRQLKLAPGASGVIRITVYDSSDDPPTPLAERLVFRRPAKRIQVQVDPIDSPRLGEHVTLGLQTTDEEGQPAAAVLGLSVVHQALLNVANDRSANLETHVFLTSEIRNADELEDANFFLGTSDEAAAAMDLLLGTKGWRRFVDIRPDQLAQFDRVTLLLADTSAAPNAERGKLSDRSSDPLVPLVLDNRDAMENKPAAASTLAMSTVSQQWIRSRETLLQRWGTVLMIGGLLVLVAVIGLAVTRSLGRPQVWVPSVVTAGIAVVLGVFWMGSQVNPMGEIAYAPVSVTMIPAATSNEASKIDVKTNISNVADVEHDENEFVFEQEEADQKTLEDTLGNRRRALSEQAEGPRPNSSFQRTGEPQSSAGQAGQRFGADAFDVGAAPGNFAKKGKAVEANAPLDDAGPKSTQQRQLQSARPAASPAVESAAKVEANLKSASSPARAAPAPSAAPPVAAAEISESLQLKGAQKTDSSESMRFDALGLGALPEVADSERLNRRVYFNEYFMRTREPKAHSTLLWQPLFIIDATGRATVSFQLPSTNATYLLRVDAHGGGRIGSGKATIDVRQP